MSGKVIRSGYTPGGEQSAPIIEVDGKLGFRRAYSNPDLDLVNRFPGIDPDDLRAAITPKTKLILFNTPHNPTGRVFSRDEVQLIADLAIEHDLAPEQIRRAIISAPQLKVWAQQAVQPHDLIGAAHSVPYFVASALVDRRFGWDHFSLEKMRDPRIAAMLTRVSFDPDPPPHPDRDAPRNR